MFIIKMRMLWITTLVVLFLAGVHSIDIASSVTETLENLSAGESRYLICRIINGTLLETEFTGPRTSTYNDFVTDLRKTNPAESRYGVIDYEYIDNESPTKKLLLFLWSPEAESEEQRLMYTTVDKSQFEIVAKFSIDDYIVAKTDTDLDEETLLSRLKKLPHVTPKSEEETSEKVGDQ